MTNYINKARLIRLLHIGGRAANAQDTVKTLKPRLHDMLKEYGYDESFYNYKKVKRFLKSYVPVSNQKAVQDEIEALMNIKLPDSTQDLTTAFREARRQHINDLMNMQLQEETADVLRRRAERDERKEINELMNAMRPSQKQVEQQEYQAQLTAERKARTRKAFQELEEAARVISTIDGKPLRDQTITSEYVKGSKHLYDFVDDSRSFSLTFDDPHDIKFKYLWKLVMVPLLKKLDVNSEWMILIDGSGEGETPFVQRLTKDNVAHLKEAFEQCGILSPEDPDHIDELTNEPDSPLFFGRPLVFIRSIEFIDVTDYNNIGAKLHARVHHFFPFTHNTPLLDLSTYQIYKSVDDVHNDNMHCVVSSLKYYGVDASAIIPNTYQKLTSIREIEDILGITIQLRIPYKKGSTWNNEYEGTKGADIKLVSYMNHCMPDVDVDVTEYYLKHYNEILTNRKQTGDWSDEQLKQIKGMYNKGTYWDYDRKKKRTTRIEKVIDCLDLTSLSLYDLIAPPVKELTNITCLTRDIRHNEHKTRVQYVEHIDINPSRPQIVHKGKVVSEKMSKNSLKIDYHNIIGSLAPDMSLTKFKSILSSLPDYNTFELSQCTTLASISNQIFINAYRETGVKEINGSVIDELDKHRRGGLLFAKKTFINEPVITLDVNSLFPYVMMNMKLPVGDPVFGDEALKQDIYYAHVRKDNEDLYINNLYPQNYNELVFAIGWKGVKSQKLADYIQTIYDQRKSSDKDVNRFCKGLLAMAYGKTLQKNKKCMPKRVHKTKALEHLRKNRHLIKWYKRVDDDYFTFYHYKQINPFSLMHVGLQVVHSARNYMENIVKRLAERGVEVYHTQIDSIMIKKSDYVLVKDLLPTSNNIGDFKIEFESNSAYVISKGTYLMWNTCRENSKVRVLGVNTQKIDDVLEYFQSRLCK